MPYMIETFDKAGSLEMRRANRAEHLVYLDQIKDRLLACGAKLNDDGSDAGGGLYVVDVDTRAEAEALIQADPFFKVGLFERVEIRRWRKAYLDGRSYL
ncbi:YciI family protein [Methylobacterium sp. P1-11]|uniref:YciI family protein n=1 Tax=Methylobacterium sp. P1-11 TaxID=2024616 RepID=UPI0011EEF947|nr:YciI family protein [Methylobacterium sp. P1-11]KAA0121556.1 YciI family protein [Methylobacterium sp. P1-11]